MSLETFVANDQAAQAAVNRLTEPTKFRSINPAPFLCQSAVRKFLLEQAGRTRAHKYTRVSGQTMIELNEVVRQWMVLRVARLPSMGRTI
jgi:hypothetical protein